MIRDLSCYYCEDCYISKIQSCEKLEFIGNHGTVKMVEPPCEKNDERIDSDGDIIENIVEKGMVVAVLTDDPNYDQYLLKLTTGPETIAQSFSDSWGGTFDRGSKIERGLYYDMVQNKPFLFNLIPRKTAAC